MRPNYSDERREHALSWIRGEGLLTNPTVSNDAQLLAAVALLICDDAGRVDKSDLSAAMTDPSILQAARALLKEARS